MNIGQIINQHLLAPVISLTLVLWYKLKIKLKAGR